MTKRSSLLGLAIIAFSMAACHKDNDVTSPPYPRTEDEPAFPGGGLTELRGANLQDNRFRYLGRGFNLLEHRLGEEGGISFSYILDLDRMKQENPWNPWGEDVLVGLLAPKARVEQLYRPIPIDIPVHDATDSYSQDSIAISFDGKFKPSTLNFNYAKVKREETRVHNIRAYHYIHDETISFEADNELDYQYYLKPRFVKHLENMSGEQLIQTYGTHLITSYYLGAFSDFVVTAKSNTFTKEETATLTASAFTGKASLSATLASKVIQNVMSLRTTYRQGGSNYVVGEISPFSLFSIKDPVSIDISKWKEGYRPYDGTFLSLPFGGKGIVSIPSLIKNIPLKLKYTCAIMHKASPGVDVVYVLSDPKSYDPIKYKGEYVYTLLKTYEGGSCYVYYGNDSVNPVSSELLTGSGPSSANWRSQLEPNGLWVFYRSDIKKYLCTDLSLRSANEDIEGKRFWGLNPVVPTPGYSYKAWSRMLIKPNN